MDTRIWLWLKIGLVAALVVLDAVIVVYAMRKDSAAQASASSATSYRPAVPAPTSIPGSTSSSEPRHQRTAPLSQHVEDALGATTWPALRPQLRSLTAAQAPSSSSCAHTTARRVTDCTFGPADADRVAVVLGDDVGLSWLPGIRAALEPRGWRVEALTWNLCPAPTIFVIAPASEPDNDGDALTHACAAHQQWAQQEVATVRPDLVIMASGANTLKRLGSGARGTDAQNSWAQATIDTANAMPADVARIVVLGPPPEGTDIRTCDPAKSPAACAFTAGGTWKRMSAADQTAARKAPRVAYVNTSSWFCADDRCPAFVDGTVVRADGTHLTAAYSRRLAPLLSEELVSSRP